MSALYMLETGVAFCMIYPLTHILTTEIENFFHHFLDILMDMQDEYISMPKNLTKLTKVSKWYSAVGLPGVCSSIDVVHMKSSSCSTDDRGGAKGKEGFTTLGFQCITDYNRQILAVYGSQFGVANDKQIVKTDPNIQLL
jgi:hypothetical protein